MKHTLPTLFFVIALAICGAVIAAATAPSILGLWKSPDGDSAVEIAPCGAKLCGRIVWLKTPRDGAGQIPRDIHNHDATLRTRPICGLQIISGLASRADGSWGGGRVYSAGDGGSYDLTVTPAGPDKLRLRGSLGVSFLGQTFYLYRASGLPLCSA